VNTKLVAIPYRRAISVTTAPETRVYSMIRIAAPVKPNHPRARALGYFD
jgi:hypothetical protein